MVTRKVDIVLSTNGHLATVNQLIKLVHRKNELLIVYFSSPDRNIGSMVLEYWQME